MSPHGISRRVLLGAMAWFSTLLCRSAVQGKETASGGWYPWSSTRLPKGSVEVAVRRNALKDVTEVRVRYLSDSAGEVTGPVERTLAMRVAIIEAIVVGDYRGNGVCGLWMGRRGSDNVYGWFATTAESSTQGELPKVGFMAQDRLWPIGVWNAFGRDGGDWITGVLVSDEGVHKRIVNYRNLCVSVSADGIGELTFLQPAKAPVVIDK